MRFINPRTDFAFKLIFGSEADTAMLISLLNAVLPDSENRTITHIDILNPYNPPKIALLKDSYLDLRARDANGKHYLIEMQVANIKGMQKRVLYNACKQYGNQLDRGDNYTKLNEVIGITFTDFVLFDRTPELRNSFMLRDSAANLYSSDLELVFIELPKFNVDKDQLHLLSNDFDKWLYFLKHADDLSARPAEFDDDQAICLAFDAANKANLDKDEYQLYEDNLALTRDRRGEIDYALDVGHETGLQKGLAKGLAKGRVEGRAEGRAEGLEKGRLEGEQSGREQREREMVLQAHNEGWSIQRISKFFALSVELVQSIIDAK